MPYAASGMRRILSPPLTRHSRTVYWTIISLAAIPSLLFVLYLSPVAGPIAFLVFAASAILAKFRAGGWIGPLLLYPGYGALLTVDGIWALGCLHCPVEPGGICEHEVHPDYTGSYACTRLPSEETRLEEWIFWAVLGASLLALSLVVFKLGNKFGRSVLWDVRTA